MVWAKTVWIYVCSLGSGPCGLVAASFSLGAGLRVLGCFRSLGFRGLVVSPNPETRLLAC